MKQRNEKTKTNLDNVCTYDMTANQRHDMMREYQKKIHLMRQDLGRGHLDNIHIHQISEPKQ